MKHFIALLFLAFVTCFAQAQTKPSNPDCFVLTDKAIINLKQVVWIVRSNNEIQYWRHGGKYNESLNIRYSNAEAAEEALGRIKLQFMRCNS